MKGTSNVKLDCELLTETDDRNNMELLLYCKTKQNLGQPVQPIIITTPMPIYNQQIQQKPQQKIYNNPFTPSVKRKEFHFFKNEPAYMTAGDRKKK